MNDDKSLDSVFFDSIEKDVPTLVLEQKVIESKIYEYEMIVKRNNWFLSILRARLDIVIKVIDCKTCEWDRD